MMTLDVKSVSNTLQRNRRAEAHSRGTEYENRLLGDRAFGRDIDLPRRGASQRHFSKDVRRAKQVGMRPAVVVRPTGAGGNDAYICRQPRKKAR